MASNKNQHFVPRCYLRPFTSDENKKTINLFNTDREKTILGAPIKSQCSRDYFYGTDENLESAIQLVESGYASVLPTLLKRNLPLTPSARDILPKFWMLQHLRTVAASQRSVELSEETDLLLEHPIESFRIEIKQAVQFALSAFAESLHALDDLKIVLAYNRTATPFFCSDDPAILVNRWLHNNESVMGPGYGLHSAGIICVLPISPRVCCLLYDGDVYSIATSSNWFDIHSSDDVDRLNDLQYLNCAANVYFQDAAHSNLACSLGARNKGLRPATRHRIHYAIETESKDGYLKFEVVKKSEPPPHERALIHMEAVRIAPHLWPSFLKWRGRGVYYSNGTGVGHLRLAHTQILRIGGPRWLKKRTGH